MRDQRRGTLASVGLHTTLVIASAVAVFPPLWLVVTSFKPKSEAFSTDVVKEPTLRNYQHVLGDTEFLTWFGNSLFIVVITTLLGVFVAATTGYAVSRFRFPGMRPLMWLLLITQMFPVAILIVPLYNIMSTLGWLNQPISLIVTYLTVAVPFCAWMMKGFFDTIPVEIDESGRVDGLNPFGTFWRLVVPLAKPGLAVTAFYTFITAWAEVAYASAFMTGEDNLTLAAGLQTFVNQYTSDWGSMTAAAVMIAIPAALVFSWAQRHLVAGLTAGATKS
ncbi:sugar ABC transporter permease [Streptomyces rapamycinicus]|uniref:ABC transporter permease n=2 Tax=Streptomyces rapamycinicus TaxID=1226757 RepID=A0A0A0NQJ3_STRRN|nr:carbohydrate ABC transporter permease [Streptomyces rapamycinicus]AGP58458.1 ABC transporter permease [Streptomyces rapamycinicus NRRL 5491]MBB4786163.1 arabinogalactan oligomer/maltooligosaccharide transport system permease protein [Streptomyces rapamycinicus]RLV78375.1 ABC transporter permease [Streptomyces rapamycinicus NRRL 5491]UTO66274.1 carbohydrate ABC transporter permease [Streptomyces rapamycinicus]UTP34229.1 carbohydrate ABC transporter permease [Streptomyces rapamycinicus NRRL 5